MNELVEFRCPVCNEYLSEVQAKGDLDPFETTCFECREPVTVLRTEREPLPLSAAESHLFFFDSRSPDMAIAEIMKARRERLAAEEEKAQREKDRAVVKSLERFTSWLVPRIMHKVKAS